VAEWTIAVALALDLAIGDPRGRLHPVSWIGALLEAGRRRAPARQGWPLVLYGGALVAGVGALAVCALWAVEALAAPVRAAWPLAGLLLDGWLLKCALALRGLVAAFTGIERRLAAGDLPGARADLATHLVSRPTGELDAGHAASAAVESLAENVTDSLVAPLCCYALAGLPGAWAYRVINTADAMIGYRRAELEYLGKLAARADDVASWLPARLSAAALVAGAALAGGDARGAWRAWRRDGGRTASPNAGRTMAAMAGALGVRLAKRGEYELGQGPLPDGAAMARARRGAVHAAALATAAIAVAALALARVR
jgi:adenosylcobinamide-phosphate synthase